MKDVRGQDRTIHRVVVRRQRLIRAFFNHIDGMVRLMADRLRYGGYAD
jgi:hypothetical protein